MIKLLLIFILLFLKIILVSALQAGWYKVTEGSNGQVFYVDLERIEQKRGSVFFWQLIDYRRVDEYGDLSAKIYIKTDCTNLKLKWIKISYHKKAMGTDNTKELKPSNKISEWQYPSPYSTSKAVLDYVCNVTGIIL